MERATPIVIGASHAMDAHLSANSAKAHITAIRARHDITSLSSALVLTSRPIAALTGEVSRPQNAGRLDRNVRHSLFKDKNFHF